jgi:dTMP kinase
MMANFIVIEGIDGCGKSTQAKLLTEHLQARYMKFPNADSPTGKLIYQHLEEKWHARPLDASLAGKGDEINALMFQCLQFTNRLEMAQEIAQTLHTLKQDIVSDRYMASAIVYGGADGLDVGYLINTQQWLPQPDLNILIDIPIRASVSRRPERRDRYEDNLDFLRGVMGRYLSLWARMMGSEGDRWAIVNGDRSVEEVHRDIVETVTKHANRAH